jgi:hypothetical protein
MRTNNKNKKAVSALILLQSGLALHQAGRLQKAKKIYKNILKKLMH